MEEAQHTAWDELETLNQKLQEERKKNMSNVLTDRMKAIKEEKILRMKNIKRLQVYMFLHVHVGLLLLFMWNIST
jgi:hypothetical protein